MRITGVGKALGSVEVDCREQARALGLDREWFVQRTGIETRRVCNSDEDAYSLACTAITKALEDAGVDRGQLGDETVLVHIQNGGRYLTPPAVFIVAQQLGLTSVRALGVDGVCAEPIAAMEIASLLLDGGRADRVILSAAVDFIELVDPSDLGTAALFGAGAAAVLLEPGNPSELKACRYRTRTKYWDAGTVLIGDAQPAGDHLDAKIGYYQMDGPRLARVALEIVPEVVFETLKDANWELEQIDRLVAHQPNAKLLEIGMRRMGIPKEKVALPVVRTGNLGPASVLSALEEVLSESSITETRKLLLVSFGLGFSCGAAALEVGP